MPDIDDCWGSPPPDGVPGVSNSSFQAVTILLPTGMEVLVRVHDDGEVEVDLRPVKKYGPRVWTPVALHGGSFTVERCQNMDWNTA